MQFYYSEMVATFLATFLWDINKETTFSVLYFYLVQQLFFEYII